MDKNSCKDFKIMVVEDEKSVRSALMNKLLTTGFQFLEAKNGEEGLKIIKSERPDLILVDVKMPIMGGIEMIRRLKEDPDVGNTPFIVLTNDATTETMTDVMSVGGNHYFIKADTPIEAIIGKIKLMLNCE